MKKRTFSLTEKDLRLISEAGPAEAGKLARELLKARSEFVDRFGTVPKGVCLRMSEAKALVSDLERQDDLAVMSLRVRLSEDSVDGHLTLLERIFA